MGRSDLTLDNLDRFAAQFFTSHSPKDMSSRFRYMVLCDLFNVSYELALCFEELSQSHQVSISRETETLEETIAYFHRITSLGPRLDDNLLDLNKKAANAYIRLFSKRMIKEQNMIPYHIQIEKLLSFIGQFADSSDTDSLKLKVYYMMEVIFDAFYRLQDFIGMDPEEAAGRAKRIRLFSRLPKSVLKEALFENREGDEAEASMRTFRALSKRSGYLEETRRLFSHLLEVLGVDLKKPFGRNSGFSAESPGGRRKLYFFVGYRR